MHEFHLAKFYIFIYLLTFMLEIPGAEPVILGQYSVQANGWKIEEPGCQFSEDRKFSLSSNELKQALENTQTPIQFVPWAILDFLAEYSLASCVKDKNVWSYTSNSL